MKLDVKTINKFCKKEATDPQDFCTLRIQLIAQLVVDELFDTTTKDMTQMNSIAQEAVRSFPKLTPCERAFLELQVKVFCLAKQVESWKC